jgi:hypothetical protein
VEGRAPLRGRNPATVVAPTFWNRPRIKFSVQGVIRTRIHLDPAR